MSVMENDEVFAAELRQLADVEQPAIDLDPRTVLHGGRARRRRRAVGTGVASVLASGALVLAIAQLAGLDALDRDATPPAQEPRTFGAEQTTELAPGVIAANLPRAVERAGTTYQDLGFTSRFVETIAGSATSGGPTLLEPRDDIEIADWEGPGRQPLVAGFSVQTEHGGELYGSVGASWIVRDAPEDYVDGAARQLSPLARVGLPHWSHEQFTFGAVPSWLPGPRVLLFSEEGFTLEDGTVEHSLEVPTFRGLTLDRRLLFAVKITEEQGEYRGDDAEQLVDVVVFRGADGSVYVGDQCGAGGFAACLEAFGNAFRSAIGLDAGHPGPTHPDGTPLPITSIDPRTATAVDADEVYTPIATLPDTFEDGSSVLHHALMDDGRVLVTASSENTFDGDRFLAPERMGLWGPTSFEMFEDVSPLPPGDPFRYSYFASVEGGRAAWVETSSTQGTGLWRIFSRDADGTTRLVAKAEDGGALGFSFGGDAEPVILGDRVVWTTETSFSGGSAGTVLVSAPFDGSGPLRVEHEADSQPAVGEAGAYFAHDGGTQISVLGPDGSVEPVISYAFTEQPWVTLSSHGSVLAVGVSLRSDDESSSWLDVIELDSGTAVRVNGVDPSYPRASVCEPMVAWAESGESEENPRWTTFFLDLATGTLSTVGGSFVGEQSCAGGRLLVSEVDDPETSTVRRLLASLR